MKKLKILAAHFDKILEKYFKEEYGDNFITFGPSSDVDIKITNSICSCKEILDQLPEGWYPDILLISWPEQWLFNFDIMEIDCLTVAFVVDWVHYYYAVNAVSQAFDVFIAWGEKIGNILKKMGCKNVYYQIYSHEVTDFFDIPLQDKKYDVTFLGCTSNRLWPNRVSCLERMALLGNKYNINIKSGIWGDEYKKILKQSKIVFNNTLSETMNSRVFEVLSSGSFLLTNKNEEIVNFFEDNVHMGLYTNDNLESKIDYYLKNDLERESIAQKGFDHLRQFHKAESRVKEMINILNSLDLEKQKYDRLKNKSDDTNLIQIAKSIIAKGKYDEAMSLIAHLNSPVVCNINACTIFLRALHHDMNDKSMEYQKAISILENINDDIFVYLNLVAIYTLIGNYDKSHESLFKAKLFLESHPYIKWKEEEIYLLDFDFEYEMNFIKESNTVSFNKDVFIYLVSDIIHKLYESVCNSYNYDILREYLKNRIDFQIGLMYLFKNDLQTAVNVFEPVLVTSDNKTELSFMNYIKANFLEILGNNEEAYIYYKKAYSLRPFYMQARYKASNVLKEMEKSYEAALLDSENELLNRYKDAIDYYK